MQQEENVQIGGLYTIQSIELSEDAKYYLTVTDGVRTWRVKWNKKKMNDFRDSLFAAPKTSTYKRPKNFFQVGWIFSEKAEQDYERLMSLYNVY